MDPFLSQQMQKQQQVIQVDAEFGFLHAVYVMASLSICQYWGNTGWSSTRGRHISFRNA
jgi:hypothetical protein